jgi:hypothetical protein
MRIRIQQHLFEILQDQVLDLIVERTNQKIEDDFVEKNYSAETMAKSPHIAYVDKVKSHLMPQNRLQHLFMRFYSS